MNTHVFKTLEFNKVRDRLAAFASSEAGAARCEKLLPMTDLEEIRTALITTTDAVNRLRKKAAPRFGTLSDIRPSVKRLNIGSTLNIVEILEISGLLDSAVAARRFLAPESDETPDDSLSAYYAALDPCSSLSAEIKRCILSYDEIADDASPTLRDIRRHMADARLSIQHTLNKLITSQSMQSYLQDSIVTMRNGRYCIPVKAEHRNHVPGMIHDQSGSGKAVFIEPAAVVELNNKLKELDLAEKAEIQVILANISAEADACSESILTDYRLLVELDFILAKALYSESIKGNAPEFNNEGYIDLKQARHPLLEVHKAVPIHIQLGKEFQMLIITGPNTGGKTVSLKTAGLLCLMGQAGLHIPALEGSSLCIFDEIYADIGDEQSIEQSLSTFSSHMKNIVEILKQADDKSLVLLDELCSGTDPAEGAALAQSILTRLHHYGSRVMSTTHYPELKVYALTTEGVQNACCEFDIETLRPTYRLLIGLPGKSNAFAISEKLGLEKDLIQDAAKRLDEESVAFEDLLANIESDKKSAELERAEASRMRAQAMAELEALQKERDALTVKKETILQKAKDEAYEMLQSAKNEADAAIKDFRKAESHHDLSAMEKSRTALGQKSKKALEKRGRKTVQPQTQKKISADTLAVDDPVHVRTMHMDGVVTALPDHKGNLSVRVGSMNMQVKITDLEAAHEDSMDNLERAGGQSSAGARKKYFSNRQAGDAGHGRPHTNIGSIQYEKSRGVSTEIKLLGMTVDDALLELGKYLDDASMAHLEKVRIVHGKGTGALRSAVQQYLRREKRVKKFYQAEYGEGDAGVTIAELK